MDKVIEHTPMFFDVVIPLYTLLRDHTLEKHLIGKYLIKKNHKKKDCKNSIILFFFCLTCRPRLLTLCPS